MQNNPLSLAVVGHTNTGKTSLLRTLLRDGAFGEVADAPSTTRHVERSAVSDGPDTLVYLYDTPGLEDAGGLLDWLESHTPSRSDGIERLQLFLDSPEAAADFNQEAKVLRQLLQSDMALYVVDAREPVLNKYKDELTVLSWCAKPVMPVFNFVGGQDLSAWTTMLARRNLHVYSGFDTVAFDFEGEIRLWDNLATMLPERTVLDRLIAMRRREWHQLDGEAKRETALPTGYCKLCRPKCASLKGSCSSGCFRFTVFTKAEWIRLNGRSKPSAKTRSTVICWCSTAYARAQGRRRARLSAWG